MRVKVILVVFLSVGVVALAVVGSLIYAVSRPAPACMMEWSDYFQLNGIVYSAVGNASIPIESEYGRIESQLIGRPCDDIQLQDGVASILEAGTPIYTVQNYAPYFRLAIRAGNEIRLYEVSRNATASNGDELFDIRDKVQAIEIDLVDVTGRQEPARLATISEPGQIASLVEGVLKAPVQGDSLVSNGETVYALNFRLIDGTTSTCWYWIDRNLLEQRLHPTSEFQQMIRQAIQ